MSGREPEVCEERRRDEIAAYALGALPSEEARELEAHLAGCAACSDRLRWLEPAVDVIPASVEQLEPPPALRERLMAEVRSEHEASAIRTGGEVRRRPERRRWRLPGLAPLRPAIAAMVAIALVLGALGGYLLAGDDGATTYAVQAEAPRAEAGGTLEVDDGRGTLLVEDLPPIPSDRVYQAWISSEGRISPSSVFVVREDGSGSAAIPDIPAEADAILVTTEPAGGSETPRTAPVLRADLD